MLKFVCLFAAAAIISLVAVGEITIEAELQPMVMFGALSSAILLALFKL